MANQDKQYYVIMANDGSYAIIKEERTLSSKQERADSVCYEVHAPLFIPIVVPHRVYDLAMVHSSYGFRPYPEPCPDLISALKVVEDQCSKYAEKPDDLSRDQTDRYEEEFEKARSRSDNERKRILGPD